MISTWPQLVLNELHICVNIPLGFHAMTIKDQHNYGAPKGLTSVMFVYVCVWYELPGKTSVPGLV